MSLPHFFETWKKLPYICHLCVKFFIESYSGWAFLVLLRDWQKASSLPKICHAYPTMMKLGAIIPYLKKIQKTYKSHDTPLGFS